MQRSSDLLYGFSVDAPMQVLFMDIYASGPDISFDGNHHNLIAAYGMTGFSVFGLILEQTTKTLASALIKIWLRFGFFHTIVVEKI